MKQSSGSTYIALLHHPVYDRGGRIVTTSVANMDIHDLSRCARTYEIRKFFIVTPLSEQQKLVRAILNHWRIGYGAGFNLSRKEAFERAEVVGSLDEVISAVASEGKEIKLVATGAGLKCNLITYGDLRAVIESREGSYLILFGTGSGLAEQVVSQCDYLLEPIHGAGDYNHLSVRSAAAIVLDRLFGNR